MMSKFFGDFNFYNSKHTLTDISYKVEDDSDLPASHYIENGLTATHKVYITYEIDGDKKEPRYTEFEVPREIDGAFILEGSYRMATNTLGQDWNCRINMSGSGRHDINFDYNRVYDFESKVLKVKKYNPELGIIEQKKDIKFDDLTAALNNPEIAELLKLDERQAKKLQIKLDLDYYPEFITPQLITDCEQFGDDRQRDLVIDKTIDSVPRSFMQFLFRENKGRNWFGVRKQILNYFYKHGSLPNPINSISNLCRRYWKGGKDVKSELQISPGINAINLQSYLSKITIPKTVAYNNSFGDLIDVGDTPINGNVGVQNALTVSTHVQDDGTILFDVYDKDFNKITIDYLDYLNKKVVASDYVDYETNTLKPNSEGKVEVKYRMKRKMVPVENIDLIDLHPDYRLSSTTRQIPFVNFTDSVRVHMGGSMSKQTIPLPNGQHPLVASGNTEELTNNVLNEHFQAESGVVKEINDTSVVIEAKDGSTKVFPRRTAIQSMNDVDVFVEPKVKVGQKVKKGDIIMGAHELDSEKGFKMGINTLVLYGPHHGLTNEDAVVVSESYTERMASYSLIDISIDVPNSAAIKWIAPIGTKVKSKEDVVILYKALQLSAVNKIITEKLGPLFIDENGKGMYDYTYEKSLIVPNNIDEAVVSDVLIQENTNPKFNKKEAKPDFTFAKTSAPIIEAYEKSKDRQVIYDSYPEYIAADRLRPIALDAKSPKTLYTIRVRLIKKTKVVVGSKLTNRFGGKGVVSAIEPDEKMPILKDEKGNEKRVELIMNPYSTINRKIPSVIMEIGCANCVMKIHDLVDQYKTTATNRKKIMPLIKKYYPGKYDDMTVEEFIKLHDSSKIEDVYALNVGCYSTYTPEKIQEMMDDLGVSTQSKVLYPALDLMDLEELKETLDEEEYEKVLSENRGKYREVQKPLMAGYVTMIQLYHMPMYANKCTTDMTDTKRSGVIAPRGAYRQNGGQSIGEMELGALLSRNAKQFIHSYRAKDEREQNQRFLNNLIGLGMIITDEKGFPQGGSNMKATFSKMKNKYKFRNGGV